MAVTMIDAADDAGQGPSSRPGPRPVNAAGRERCAPGPDSDAAAQKSVLIVPYTLIPGSSTDDNAGR
jgi:hypothetical protein